MVPDSLGRSGLKISRIVLGTMSYGSPEWQKWVLAEKDALPMLKHAYDVGINTWDTADVYSNGLSEEIVGKSLHHYNIPRSEVVILTKCFYGVSAHEQLQISAMAKNNGRWVNRVGLSRKHIFDAVDASVVRLGTYIDVLQIHRLDRDTPAEEIMQALNDVIESGKVRCVFFHNSTHLCRISSPNREIGTLAPVQWQLGRFRSSRISQTGTAGISSCQCKITITFFTAKRREK